MDRVEWNEVGICPKDFLLGNQPVLVKQNKKKVKRRLMQTGLFLKTQKP
jgi:hypothetical protein